MRLNKNNLSRPKRKRAFAHYVGSVFLLGAAALAAAFFAPHHRSVRSAPLPVATVVMCPQEGPDEADLLNPQAAIVVLHERKRGVPFVLIEGGVAQTRRSARRCGVDRFVRQAGAQAGLNGTFFADASVQGTDHILIGPSLCGNEARAVFNPSENVAALTGRPLVLLSPGRTRILPYHPRQMASQSALASGLPGLTDAFLGGVWLVHHGHAADEAHIAAFHVHDAEDPRRRAFFCLLPDRRLGLGATSYVATSAELARALSAAGIREAVLLDSGFSTSLVYGRKILVTGHTSPGIPSRPIPHALVLFGKRNQASTARAPGERAPIGV